jgi:hypothetical protein
MVELATPWQFALSVVAPTFLTFEHLFECFAGWEEPEMVRIDELVDVAVNPKGEPIGFSWRNGAYLVLSKPVRWFARREWWVESARVQRGIGAGVLEVEMWRLVASCAEEKKQFELIHNIVEDKNVWKLSRIY